MVPKEPLHIVRLPKAFRGVFSNVYVCIDGAGREFLFKEAKSEKVIENELLAHRIGRIAGVFVLDFLERMTVDGIDGLVMTYLNDAVLLAEYGKKLSPAHVRELQRIVLFDLLIGNRDRHAANILVGKHLVAFDHGRVFVDKSSAGIKHVKFDVGRLLDPEYSDKLEKISLENTLSTGDVLVNWLGFRQRDLDAVKSVADNEVRKAVDGVKCPDKRGKDAFEYVAFRKRVFDRMSYF